MKTKEKERILGKVRWNGIIPLLPHNWVKSNHRCLFLSLLFFFLLAIPAKESKISKVKYWEQQRSNGPR